MPSSLTVVHPDDYEFSVLPNLFSSSSMGLSNKFFYIIYIKTNSPAHAMVHSFSNSGRDGVGMGHRCQPSKGLPQVSLQCQGDTYKDKCSWADFRNVLSHKRTMRLFCYILMGFTVIWGLQMIHAKDGNYYYICTIRTQSTHFYFSSGEFCCLSLALRRNFSLPPSTGEFSSWCLTLHVTHTSLSKESKGPGSVLNIQGSLSHSRHGGRERLGGEMARLRSLRCRTVW